MASATSLPGQKEFDQTGDSPYDEKVGLRCGTLPNYCQQGCENGFFLLPLRSMVGQLPLEQHIGVRIPEGQPIDCKELNLCFG